MQGVIVYITPPPRKNNTLSILIPHEGSLFHSILFPKKQLLSFHYFTTLSISATKSNSIPNSAKKNIFNNKELRGTFPPKGGNNG